MNREDRAVHIDVLRTMGRAAMLNVIKGMIEPSYVIGAPGKPYLLRWHLQPEGAHGTMYLHKILRDDDDRALHDHPWDAFLYIIEGSYREIRPDAPDGEWFGPDSHREIKAENPHRLVVVSGPVWTLCITGPRRREWGFHCPQGWVPYHEFVDARDHGQIGKGCG